MMNAAQMERMAVYGRGMVIGGRGGRQIERWQRQHERRARVIQCCLISKMEGAGGPVREVGGGGAARTRAVERKVQGGKSEWQAVKECLCA